MAQVPQNTPIWTIDSTPVHTALWVFKKTIQDFQEWKVSIEVVLESAQKVKEAQKDRLALALGETEGLDASLKAFDEREWVHTKIVHLLWKKLADKKANQTV